MTEEADNEDAVVGHNSAINKETQLRLKSIVERVERLEEEKKDLGNDIKEVFLEAKSIGLDTKVIRKIIAMRKREADEVNEEKMIIETYCRALGMGSYLD